jgi:hypothetical protein
MKRRAILSRARTIRTPQINHIAAVAEASTRSERARGVAGSSGPGCGWQCTRYCLRPVVFRGREVAL